MTSSFPRVRTCTSKKKKMNVCIKSSHAKHMPNRLGRDEEILVLHCHFKYDIGNDKVHVHIENLH